MSRRELLRGFIAAMVLLVLLAMFWGGMGLVLFTGNALYFLLCPLAAFLCIVLKPFFESAWNIPPETKGGKK